MSSEPELSPIDALEVIRSLCHAKDHQNNALAQQVFRIADDAVAEFQEWPKKPDYMGERVHWHRDGRIMTGYVVDFKTNARHKPARVRAEGSLYTPRIQDYCDEQGIKSRPWML